MENSSINFAENMADDTLLEAQYSVFNAQAFDPKEPGDGEEEQDQEQGEDKSTGEDADNPPLDPDVVHSPVTTEPGGNPKRG